MSLEKIRIGVLDIELPIQSNNTMGSLVGITPTVCAVAQSDTLANDINSPLKTSDTYQFIVGLVGEDRSNGGYTVGFCSQATGIVSPASNKPGLSLHISNGSWPANFDEAVCAAIFIKINSASKFQLCKLAYIDPDNDFNSIISHLPLRSAPKFTAALLQSTTADPILGDRVPYGFTFEKVEPTENEITEIFDVTTVNVNPNNGPAFNVRTTVAAGLEFQLLLNDIKSIVRSIGGFYDEYTAQDSNVIQEGQFGLATAQAILKGNKPVRVNYPPDGQGNAEVGLYLGLRTQNDQGLRMAWSKSATTPVQIAYQAAILDTILISQHTKVSYLVKQ